METFLTTILIAGILLLLSVIFLATQMILKKDGKFPETEVSQNENMKKLGITCAKCDEEKSCSLTSLKTDVGEK
ncbi:MAG: hypothetical protein A2W91_17805 [Bacteroidetes bacterium GWF2_38_335]|nr:MAG: hypothetical protein A2W91_17805 [Bacteroidetes bacterium GWF2_38_335]OFY78010.1 MAG: hypothetical protein A2281_18655 [Bacteroidetes bacterium RIFOXYA12_FULL_38_20]HBS88282.1 hypothetical protein [Bacteroidales bacterium]